MSIAIPEREREARAGVSVWASAGAGVEGAMVLTAEPIDWIRPSERMMGVRNPFPSEHCPLERHCRALARFLVREVI